MQAPQQVQVSRGLCCSMGAEAHAGCLRLLLPAITVAVERAGRGSLPASMATVKREGGGLMAVMLACRREGSGLVAGMIVQRRERGCLMGGKGKRPQWMGRQRGIVLDGALSGRAVMWGRRRQVLSWRGCKGRGRNGSDRSRRAVQEKVAGKGRARGRGGVQPPMVLGQRAQRER